LLFESDRHRRRLSAAAAEFPANAKRDVVGGDVVDVQALVRAGVVEGGGPSAARVAKFGAAVGQIEHERGRHVIGQAAVEYPRRSWSRWFWA
jgi:uracil-DNA glycosylase